MTTEKSSPQNGELGSSSVRTGSYVPTDDFSRLGTSVSEPHLPSTVSYEDTTATQSPFTALPEAFFRRRAGMTMLARSRSRSMSNMTALIRSDPSFEVEHLGDVKAVDSGWLDDDVEEVMVVSRNKKKRRPLSVIVEVSEGHSRRSFKPVLKNTASVDANHFEYICSLHQEDACESILARHSDDGQVYTVKLVRKSGRDDQIHAERIRNEKAALKALTSHGSPFLVKLWWSFEDERAMYLVTDRTDGRNLQQLIVEEGPLSGREAVMCAAELVAGICGIHELGIVHTSVQPSCVFVGQEGHIVIADFQTARVVFGKNENAASATASNFIKPTEIAHHAPELVLGWEYNYSADWWSFGLLLFWIFTGSHPFVDETDFIHPSIVRSKILHAKLPENYLGIDEVAYELVVMCLQRNPALRIDGLGVKVHEYFQKINWDDIVTKRSQAPFHSLDPDACPTTAEIPPPRQKFKQVEPFVFDWQRDLSSRNAHNPLELSQMTHGLQILRIEQDRQGGYETLLPTSRDAAIPAVSESTPVKCETPVENVSDPLPAENLHDPDVSILPEVVMTPIAGLPTPPNSRVGNLRKYSSLHFDDVDSLDSTSSVNIADAMSSTGRLVHAQSALLLRKSKSILGISRESLRDKDVDDTSAAGSARWRSKLRKRVRADTPVPPTPSVPAVDLPRGVQKIGDGIGYTYRGGSRHPALNLASLTPRTCHGIFNGRLSKSGVKGKRKEDSRFLQTQDAKHAEFGRSDLAGEAENEEDLMDEVMREIYGDEWNDGLPSSQSVTPYGWTDVPMMNRFGMAEDASFAGADCTLRLVTSPSTPRLNP